LPSQTDNGGKFLYTDGTTLSWQAAAPGAPSGVSATVPSIAGQINVSWNAVAGATAYTIFYGTTNPVTVTNYSGTVTVSTNSGSITGLAIGTYYIAVQTQNSAGTSILSAQVSGSPYTIPTAPTLGSVSLATTTSVSVSYTANSTGNPSPTYRIYYGTTNPITTSNSYVTTSSSPATISGLAANSTYYFKVAAVNSYGITLSTSQASVLTPPAGTVLYSAGQTLTATSGSGTFFCASNVTKMTVEVIGAGGGGGGGWNYVGGSGGAGGKVGGTYTLQTNRLFTYYVGTGGSPGTAYYGAGDGGGSSAVVIYGGFTPIAAAGGGGGGGSGWNSSEVSKNAGSGGNITVNNGPVTVDGSAPSDVGTGGNAASGRLGGNGNRLTGAGDGGGSLYGAGGRGVKNDIGYPNGGGGGGGYAGGNGGGALGGSGAGGTGGTSYLASNTVAATTSLSAPGGSGGGTSGGTGGSGTDGQIKITFIA
jgi:hypothetical protein